MAQSATQEKPPFVGRKAELRRIEEMLANPNGPSLLWVVAGAGMGKSRLLLEANGTANEAGYLTCDPLDFFSDGTRTREGVLETLATRFGCHRGEFAERRADYLKAVERQDELGLRLAVEQMAEVLAALLRDLVNAHKPIGRGLLICDTVEEVVGSDVAFWFFARFLPRLSPHFLVLAGGRRIDDTAEAELARYGATDSVKLGPLSDDEVWELLGARLGTSERARRELDELSTDPTLSKQLIANLHGDAQVLIADLTAVTVSLGRTSLKELAQMDSSEALRKQLVDYPVNDGTSEGEVLLRLLHAKQGLSAEMLPLLFDSDELGTKDYASFLSDRIIPLPQVRYHKDAGVVRLHDYYFERAGEIWKVQDPTYDVRRGISEKLLPYFDAAYDEAKKAAGGISSPVLDRLVQQRLYHLLFADIARGCQVLWDTVDELWRANRDSFAYDLLVMAREVNNQFESFGQREDLLDAIIATCWAWMYSDNEENEIRSQVLRWADNVIEIRAEFPKRLRLRAKAAKGKALRSTNQTGRALSLLSEARRGYDELIATITNAESGDSKARSDLEAERGLATLSSLQLERHEVLSIIGVLHRQRSEYSQSLRVFEDNYRLATETDNLRWRGSAASQVGTILRYLGEILQAEAMLLKGLELREQLGAPGQIAQALTALGRHYRDTKKLAEARESFSRAIELFELVRSNEDVAIAKLELSWVETLEGNFDEAEGLMLQADKDLLHSWRPTFYEKYGKMELQRALQSTDEFERGRRLEKASKLLKKGNQVSGNLDTQLYAALCRAALIRVSDLINDDDAVWFWTERLDELEQRKRYVLNWAYAERDQVLAERAYRRAVGYDDTDALHEAAARYRSMMMHYARHSPVQFAEKLEVLLEWLRKLPEDWRQRAGRVLISGSWPRHTGMATRRTDFVAAVIRSCDLDMV